MSKLAYIPQIWADTLRASIERSSAITTRLWKEEQARHEQRMAQDPEYARAYELRKAEDEAESYWDALYDNQLPELDDEEDW